MAGRVERVDNLSLAAGLFEKLRRGSPASKSRPVDPRRTADVARATPAPPAERRSTPAAPPPANRAEQGGRQPAARSVERESGSDWQSSATRADEFPGDALGVEPSFEEIVAAQPAGPAAAQVAGAGVTELEVTRPDAASSNAIDLNAEEPDIAGLEPAGLNAEAAEAGGLDVAERTTSPAAQPSHYWTWRLLAGGFSPAECATIRGMTTDVVLDHALRAIDSGSAVEVGWLLSADLTARLERLIGDREPERIRPLLAKLPRGTRYEEVQLFLKCRFPKQPAAAAALSAPADA
jgi:hypothetical protein